jgi:hypothetical protein
LLIEDTELLILQTDTSEAERAVFQMNRIKDIKTTCGYKMT